MTQKNRPLQNSPFLLIGYPRSSVSYSTGQCDACSGSEAFSFTSDPVAFPNGVYRAIPFSKAQVDDEHHVLYTPWTQYAPFVVNRNAKALIEYFKHPNSLVGMPTAFQQAWGSEAVQKTLKHMVELGILVPMACSLPALVEKPGTLTAWLHVTDRCNLNCVYCYLSHVRADMSVETGRAAIEATFRSALAHHYCQVKLKYAGGEPLLNFSHVTALHQYAQNLADQYGLDLKGVVLSNGTLLTPEIVDTMEWLGLSLIVSLDGLGDFQDRQRAYANKHGSTAGAAARGVELALARGLVPNVSITVSGRNVEGLPELIAWILVRDLPFSLNFYRENDLSAAHADLRLDEEKIISGMLAVYKVIEAHLPRRSLLASLVDLADLSALHLRMCGVGHSYLVFDCLGQVSKCQMQIDKPVTTVYEYDPLALIRADKTGIPNITVEEKEGCRSCEWKYWCMGGCPFATYRATGRYDVKSPYCNIYRALYPEAIRLEGLRLLRHHGAHDFK